jgi:hypothetical protein
VDEIHDLLTARRLELLKSKELPTVQLSSIGGDIPRTQTLLEDAKASYIRYQWPMILGRRSLTKEEASELILLLAAQVDLFESQQKALAGHLKILDQGLSMLGVKTFQADDLLVQTQAARVRQASVGNAATSKDISTKLSDLGATVSPGVWPPGRRVVRLRRWKTRGNLGSGMPLSSGNFGTQGSSVNRR